MDPGGCTCEESADGTFVTFFGQKEFDLVREERGKEDEDVTGIEWDGKSKGR